MNLETNPLLADVHERIAAVLPGALADDFARRFEAHGSDLFDALSTLYGARSEFAAWFGDLLAAAARLHAERPAELRALDEVRLARPEWFLSQTMLGYSAYVDRFAGTLAGLTERVDYLQELGVTYLHLLPFLRARSGDNDGGFAVADYDAVEPALGTMADLEQLTARLRTAGISLCADFVLNHVADDHAWAQAARAGDARRRAFFHVLDDRAEVDALERHLGQIFPQTAPGNFTRVAELGGWVWTTFYPYQWDLDYGNPEVFAEMACALLRLANRGVEVFRLDSAAFLWKRPGTACANLPEAHVILQALRALVDIVAPGVLLKAEAIVPTRELPPYFGSGAAFGRECHLAYHSSLMAATWAALAEQKTDILRVVAASTPQLPQHASWVTYLRCHDDIGWHVLRADVPGDAASQGRLAAVADFYTGAQPGSFARGMSFQAHLPGAAHGTNGMAASLLGLETADSADERHAALARLALALGLALCFGGLPFIYMGDELGQLNHYAAVSGPAAEVDGRWLHRPAFDQASFAERGDDEAVAGAVYRTVQRLARLRAAEPALAADVPRAMVETGNDAVFGLARGADFVFVGNFSAAAQAVRLAGAATDGEWVDLLSGRAFTASFELEPWQSAWLRRA